MGESWKAGEGRSIRQILYALWLSSKRDTRVFCFKIQGAGAKCAAEAD